MKNWYIAFGLCASLWCYCQSYNNVINPKVYKSEIDFSGEWKLEIKDDKNSNLNESFVINIQKENGKYIGNYCRIVENGRRQDCSDQQNLTLTLNGEELNVLFLSQWGGMVKGVLKVKDIHSLSWQKQQQLGESFIPNTATLKGDNFLFSESEIYLIPPFNEENLGDFKKARLADARIRLDVNTNLSNAHYLAEIKSPVSRIQTFLFSDCNKQKDCKRYLVTINSEGETIDILELTPHSLGIINVKQNIEDKVEGYEIDKDFIITLKVNRYKKNRLNSTIKKMYQLNYRGQIEEIKDENL